MLAVGLAIALGVTTRDEQICALDVPPLVFMRAPFDGAVCATVWAPDFAQLGALRPHDLVKIAAVDARLPQAAV